MRCRKCKLNEHTAVAGHSSGGAALAQTEPVLLAALRVAEYSRETGCGFAVWHRSFQWVFHHEFSFLYLFPLFPSCEQMKHALNFQESDCCGSSCGKSNAQQAPIIHNNFV